MTLMRALQDFAALPRELSLNPLATPWDPKVELRKLDTAVTELKAAAASLRPPNPDKIKHLANKCKSAGYKLTGFELRDIRLMSWDSELLANEVFRSHLAEYVRSAKIKPNLLVLSKVYFSNWGNHVQPEIFEQMLRILANSQGGYTPLLKRYKEHANAIFDSKAHSFLGRLVFSSEQQSVPSVLSDWDIAPTTPLASAVIENFADRGLSEFCGGQTWVLDALTATLNLPATGVKTFQKVAERLILSEQADRSEVVRKKIEAFVLDHQRLGDPRLQHNMPKWVGIDPAAQRKFKTWRATKDLVFFFRNVMRQGSDPHGRKDFWLRYVDQVEDSVVALCPTDLQRLALALSNEQVHHCKIIENQQVSCFMMRFRGAKEGLVVAEFSNVGRVRFFSYDAFVKNVGSMNKSEFRLKELKTDEGVIESFSHTPLWKEKARNTLAYFGIRSK
jgi:hypothetical protein